LKEGKENKFFVNANIIQEKMGIKIDKRAYEFEGK